MNFSISCLFNYNLLNWTSNEESMQKVGRFSVRAFFSRKGLWIEPETHCVASHVLSAGQVSVDRG